MNQISLNGTDWTFKGYQGEDWLWRNAQKSQTNDINHWHPASVPGSVLHDALQNSLIPDPYVGMNSLDAEWVPQRSWVYKKAFSLPPSVAGMSAQLCFSGVDYHARYFLNNEPLGDHTGMYTPARFDVTGLLHYDQENVLAVVISPAPDEQPQVGYSSRVRTHKSRMTYWWDFCPRMVHQGIWQDVSLRFYRHLRIDDLYVRPRLNENLDAATVDFLLNCTSLEETHARVRFSLTQGEQTVLEAEMDRSIIKGHNEIHFQCDLTRPLLWAPNGSGEQPLYEVRVEILTPDHAICDAIEKTFGIRKLQFIANEKADPDALPYTLSVNGRKTYIKGWNWVPIDAMYGVPQPEKLNHLLQLAKKAHVNLLRVWGGGLIETESFYDLCDRLGILVWQEFIQSSSGIENSPPDDPDFIHFMQTEAAGIIPLKRNHPSLAAWCGGNELSNVDSVPSDDNAPLLAALKRVVNELDPDRAWFPTSFSGKHASFDLRNDPKADPKVNHDVHGPWEYQGPEDQYTLYNGGGDSLLHSEFGVEGITNLRTLNATFPADRQLPVSLTNPFWEHRGAWWIKEKDWKNLFGEWKSVEMAVHATQFMQAEGLRYAVEADRRRQYHNSGSMPWQFNEPFPMSACTSAVDYYGHPKPAYYAVRTAYEPFHLSARYSALVHSGRDLFNAGIYCSNSGSRLEGDLTVSLRDGTGKQISHQTMHCECPENATQYLLDFQADLKSIQTGFFFMDMALHSASGDPVTSSRVLFCIGSNLAPLFYQPPTTLRVEQEGKHLLVTNTGSQTALGVWLESMWDLKKKAWVYFDQDYFHLLPGETQAVHVELSTGIHEPAPISVKGWNTPSYNLIIPEGAT